MNKKPTNCTQAALRIQTYYAGKNQATHPNVIELDPPLGGYRYLMGYTAFPYANGAEENPCLAASNDLLHWEKPEGLINPIACAEELECDELKDTHLLYNKDLQRLEMWYLGRIQSDLQSGGSLYCLRKTSADLVHWSPYEVMYQFTGFNLCSPTILWEDGEYHFWGIRSDKTDTGLYFMKSADGSEWSSLERCSLEKDWKTELWHGTVIRTAERYEFVWVGKTGKNAQKIFHAVSKDGKIFTGTNTIVSNDTKWSRLYRPALLYTDGQCACFYGVVRKDGKWLIGISTGSSVNKLIGLAEPEAVNDQAYCSTSSKMRRQAKVREYLVLLVPSMALFIPAYGLAYAFIRNIIVIWFVGILITTALYYCRFNRKKCIQGGIWMGTLCCSAGLFLYTVCSEVFNLFFNGT